MFRHHPLSRALPVVPVSLKKALALGLLAGFLYSFSGPSAAAESAKAYPSSPVKIVVGFPPGNATDTVARLLASRLEPLLGQPFVVDNRAGAAGSIGTGQVAKAKPDGYTLLVGSNGTLAINPNLHDNLPYEPVRDFAPVSLLVSLPMYVVVHPDVPANTIPELVELAKKNPGEYAYGSSGNGSANHLAAAVLANTAGLDIMHVPYKGSGPALTDLIGGRLTMMVDTAPAVMQAVKAGQVKVLAVTKPTRSLAFPEVPTVAEQGYEGFDVQAWLGLAAPSGTPQEVQDKLAKAVTKIMQDPAFKESVTAVGAEPEGTTPEQFSQYLRNEIQRWGGVIDTLGLKDKPAQ